ncbi:hypothetical protein AB0L44_47060 [Nonomuraea wenchangensis]|uniref:hypothetical protein n=1 Tax=Nonomuraea wenchangensis TaxID=568860 RepID=UPI00342A5BAE
MQTKARLKGKDHDLRLLAELFAQGEPRIGRDEAGYFLSSPQLDGLISDGAFLLETAGQVLTEVNGIATLVHGSFLPVELDGHFDEAQGRKHAVIAVETVVARASVGTPTVMINGAPQPRTSPADVLTRAAAAHADVAEALRLFATRPLGWVEVYKIFEIIKANIKPTGLDTTGWVTRKDLNQLTENCNRPELGGPTARHARSAGRPGSQPLTIEKAQELISAIARRWAESLP